MTGVRVGAALVAFGLAAGMLAACGTDSAAQPPDPDVSSSPADPPSPADPAASDPAASDPATSDPETSASPEEAGQPQIPGAMPSPSHIVVVIEENHAYSGVIGNPAAPYLNSLADQGALFTNSAAVAHPSEPNYLALFSGSTQGVGDDSCPHTFAADNLGAQLAATRHSFAGYAEDLPATGYSGCTAGDYARKHSPWTNFASVPASASQPFTAFPRNYNALPTVSIVVPNLANDMHDGSVATADTWLRTNLDGYAQWAKTHNSLLIVTWDEDDDSSGNHIATIFAGSSVKPGHYSEPVDHYRVLRTIEAAYRLPPIGHAADTQPITDVW